MFQHRWKLTPRLAALIALALVVAACGPFGRSAPSTEVGASPAAASQVANETATQASGSVTGSVPEGAGTQIVEGGLTEPRTLNPVLVADPISDQLSHLVFNGLTKVDPDTAEPVGDLAKGWDVSEDRLTYTFYLRDGVTWQDGQPFGARDVVFTYDLMMNEKARSPRYSRLVERIRRVTATDQSTVEFELVQPDAAFLMTLATFGIVPEHMLSDVLPEELVTDPFGLSTAVGTGPFTLQQWARGDRIVFRRNDRYFNGKPAVEQYVFKLVSAPQDLVSGLKDGSIDWAQLPPDLAAAAETVGVRVDRLPSFDMTYVALQLDPTKSKLFLDTRVRQALLLALDRQQLLDQFWGGQGKVADGTLPPASWAYASSKTTYRQNLVEAVRLLDEAGWNVGPDGIRAKDGVPLRFNLTTNGDDAGRRQIAEWLIQSWRALGVEAQPDYESWSSVRQRVVGTRQFDALLVGYRWDVDPDQTALWSSDSFFDGFNIGHYANTDVDTLLAKALASGNANERTQLYAQIQDLVMRDLPVLPLAFPDLVVGRSARLQDLKLTAILIGNRANIERWGLAKGG